MDDELRRILGDAMDTAGCGRQGQVDGPEEGVAPAEGVTLELSAEQVGRIHDCLLDLLSARGLGPDAEPNAFGLWLESLLDVFNPHADA